MFSLHGLISQLKLQEDRTPRRKTVNSNFIENLFPKHTAFNSYRINEKTPEYRFVLVSLIAYEPS